MTEVARMDYGPRARWQPAEAAPVLDPHARERLGRSIGGITKPEEYERMMALADSLVADTLKGVEKAVQENSSSSTVAKPLEYENNNNFLAASNTIRLLGIRIDYGPVRNGRREVTTGDHEVLRAVSKVYEGSAVKVKRTLERSSNSIENQEPDPFEEHRVRWGASATMDEITASIYSELRSRGTIVQEDVQKEAESNAEMNGHATEVVANGKVLVVTPQPQKALALASQ